MNALVPARSTAHRSPATTRKLGALASLSLCLLSVACDQRAPDLGIAIPGSLRLAELSDDERARLEVTLAIAGVLDETPLTLSDDLAEASGELALPGVTTAQTQPFTLDLRLRPADGAPGDALLLARATGEIALEPNAANELAVAEDGFDTCGAAAEADACALLFDRNRNGAANLDDLLAGIDPLPPPPFLDAAPATLQFPSGIRLGAFARQVIVVENTSASAVEVKASLVGAPGVTLSRYESVIDAADGARRSLELGVVQPYEEAFLAVSFAPVNPYLTTGAVFIEAYEPLARVRQATRVKVIANADGELQPPAAGFSIDDVTEGADLGGYLGDVQPFPTAELFNGLAVTGVSSGDVVTSGLPYTGRKIRALFDEERGPEAMPADAVFLIEVPAQNRLSVALSGLARDVDLGLLLLDDNDGVQADAAMNFRPVQSGVSPEAVELRNESSEPMRALVVLGRVESFPPPAAAPNALTASDPTSFDLQTTVSSAPEFTVPLAPLTGAIEGGNRVLLTGRGFHPAATVTFADALALDCAHAEQEDGTTTLTCTTPPGSLLVGKNPATVVVANPSVDEGGDGQAATYPEGYTYLPPAPRLDDMSPRVAPTTGSTSPITLSGAFFSTRHGAPVVLFGQVPAAEVSFVDAGRLEAVAPAQAAGSVGVTVQNRLGTSDDGSPLLSLKSNARSFSYIQSAGPAPQLTSLDPATGSIDGGDTVTLSGSDFSVGADVTFGAVPSGSVTFVDAATLSVKVPARAAPGVVDVEVVNGDGQTSRLPAAYTYFIPSPTVSDAFPAEASTTGGTFIVVSGSGFRAGVQVLFTSAGGTPISSPNVNRVSTGTLLVATPAVGEGGDYGIQVINIDGQSASYAGTFRYLEPAGPAPRIDSIDPPSGFKEQPNLVTLTGSDFRGPPAILVGSDTAEVASFTDNEAPVKDVLTFYTPVVAQEGPVVVRLINSDGQSDTSVFTYFTDLDAPPQIFQVTPAQGRAGDVVTVRGSGFDVDEVAGTLAEGAQLLVRGGSLQPSSASSSEIVFTMPEVQTETPLTVEVTVKNSDGQRSSGSFLYLPPSAPPPAIYSLTPSEVPLAGAAVSLTGSGFSTTGGRLLLAGAPVSGAAFTASTVSFTAPAKAAGSYTVSVVNADGQAAHTSLRYLAPAVDTGVPVVGIVLPMEVHALVPGDAITVTGQNLAGVTSASIERAGGGGTVGTVTITVQTDAAVTLRNDLVLEPSDQPTTGTPYVVRLTGTNIDVISPPFIAKAPTLVFYNGSGNDDGGAIFFAGEMLNPNKLNGALFTDLSGQNPSVPLIISGKSETFVFAHTGGNYLMPGAPYALTFQYDGVTESIAPFPPGEPAPTFGPEPLDLLFDRNIVPADTDLSGLQLSASVQDLWMFSDGELGNPASWVFRVEPLAGGIAAEGTFTRGPDPSRVTLTFSSGTLPAADYRVVLATERTPQIAFTWTHLLGAVLPELHEVNPSNVNEGGVLFARGVLFPGNRIVAVPSGGGAAVQLHVVPSDIASGGGESGAPSEVFVPTTGLPVGSYDVCVVTASAPLACSQDTLPLQVMTHPCGVQAVPVGLGGRFTLTLDQEISESPCAPPGMAKALTFDLPVPTHVEVHLISSDVPGLVTFYGPNLCSGGDGMQCGPLSEFTGPRDGSQQLFFVDPQGNGAGTVTVDVIVRRDGSGECLAGDDDGDGFDRCSGDCAEGDAAVSPGASETCNGVDDDCDGSVDKLGPCTVGGQLGLCSEGELICVDNAPVCEQARPAGPEVCGDGADNDCDGTSDETGSCVEPGMSVIPYAPEGGPFQNPLMLGGDTHVTAPIPIAFPFHYFGKRVQEVQLDLDGRLLFAALGSRAYPTSQFPWQDADNAFVAFAWSDLVSTPRTNAAWELRGTAPNRELIIDVQGLAYYGYSVRSVNAQVVLQEAGSLIELHTDRVHATGPAVTQGFEGWCGSLGATLSPSRVAVAFGVDDEGVRFVSYGPTCGDCQCQPGEETLCASDCVVPGGPYVCGNDRCEHGEVDACPLDCGADTCGNAVCDASENSTSCAADCGTNVCGNGICDTGAAVDERLYCLQDCSANDYDYDGDGLRPSEESAIGTNDSNPDYDGDWALDGEDPYPLTADYDQDGEPDGSELLANRDPTSDLDFLSGCGSNSACDVGEDHLNCPVDCWCGNYYCDNGETSATCPWDCGSGGGDDENPDPGYCGDSMCQPGEESTCPTDCPA